MTDIKKGPEVELPLHQLLYAVTKKAKHEKEEDVLVIEPCFPPSRSKKVLDAALTAAGINHYVDTRSQQVFIYNYRENQAIQGILAAFKEIEKQKDQRESIFDNPQAKTSVDTVRLPVSDILRCFESSITYGIADEKLEHF